MQQTRFDHSQGEGGCPKGEPEVWFWCVSKHCL